MVEDGDETIERIARALRPLPDVRAEATARLLVAVAAERERERERLGRPRHARWWILGGVAAACAASVAVIALRDGGAARPASIAVAASPSRPSTGVASPIGMTAAATLPQPVQFVFRAPTAERVQVVGDFNGWNPREAAMSRDAASGLWSVSLAITPGRHVYAFVVDDSLWVRDPRAPAAKDADFGRPGSVLLVGRP